MSNIRKFENFHILLWLLKDLSWLMKWKIFGIFMIVPTVGFAALITWKTKKTTAEFLPNLAVLFWILANSFWMLMEFLALEDLKNFAVIPFSIGLVIISIYTIFFLKKNTPQL